MENLYRHIADDWFSMIIQGRNRNSLVRRRMEISVKNKQIFVEILKEVKAYGQSINKKNRSGSSFGKQAESAFKEAVADAIEEHRIAGNPMPSPVAARLFSYHPNR